MSLLNVGGLTKYYGPELIFANIGFQIAKGDKVALVGVNGAGKSTLMKIIAGIETATRGGVHLARGTRITYLAQEASFSGGRTLIEEMHESLAHLNELKRRMNELEHQLGQTDSSDWDARMEEYGELSHRFEHAGGYEIERRIERTLDGLGFTPEHHHQPVSQFSGGQKTRAALAAALLGDPDLLLLDEPTNHLDLAALEWLEQFLKSWDGTLMVISHDRYFLDKVTTRTLEVAYGRLDGDYPGGYNKFLELKAAKLELQMKMYQAQQEEFARIEDFVRRFKNSQLSKQARGRQWRLERIKAGEDKHVQLIDRPEHMKKLAIKLGTDIRSGEIALQLDHVTAGYMLGEIPRPLVTTPDIVIGRGQRVALMGPNGSGKTTLLRTIVGELPPIRGTVRLGHRVVLNYYAQSHEGLNTRNTVIEELRRIKPEIKEQEARNLLARFLFQGDDIFKRVGDLSGGERSRVALAQLTLLGGNLLVLDEPTNHLDIDAREALETVLNEYNGTILFVSHDRYFIDAVADTLWLVDDQAFEVFSGTYSEYVEKRDARALAARQREEQRKPAASVATLAPTRAPAAVSQSKASPARPDRSDDKEQRRRQRRLSALEDEIAMLEQEIKQLEQEISQAGSDAKRITSLGMQHAELQSMLATRYDEWAAVAG